MTLDDFSQALFDALNRHFPQATVTFTTTRDITLTCRAEVDADTFIFIYFSALTGKTSYALVHLDLRIAGFDNYRFWHYHPIGAPNQHIPCVEPTPEEALSALAEASAKLSSRV